MAYCLNPNLNRGHNNPDYLLRCRDCDFLLKGAHIGDYEIISFIGRGGFGDVYEVLERPPLSRKLALKILQPNKSSEGTLDIFSDEARRIANLQHTNILPVYSFGRLEELPYFVMERATGTLNSCYLKSDGTKRLASVEELVPYVQQTAEALYYIHQNGFIHQDVKPINLLIGNKGQILLSDFGTTLYLGLKTHLTLNGYMGAPAYMAPEQWRGKPRRDSDQYALAASIYDLLAGRPPFDYKDYKSREQMMMAHLQEQPQALQQLNRRIPVEVSFVLMRALAKDYQKRYSTVLDFAISYRVAVELALQRYICQKCKHQNRIGAQRCGYCGVEYDDRPCPYCETAIRFGQRCCSVCGRLTIPTNMVHDSPLSGVSVRQERYIIKYVLKNRQNVGIMVAVAYDTQSNGQKVLLKRWECTDYPIAKRAEDMIHFETVTEQLARFSHPLVPRVVERFAEGKYYYVVFTYIDGESLEDRLQKLLRPLPEHDVIGYMNSVLNVLSALEKQQPPLRHYDISPANIIIEYTRERVMLTGFQLKRPNSRRSVTLKFSPYFPPPTNTPYDQHTCIYMLAASMHHVLTNYAPSQFPGFPAARTLNPLISPELEAILSRALMENIDARYQTYAEMQSEIKRLL